MNEPNEFEINTHTLIGYVFLWFILNAILIGIGALSLAFMVEQANFYGKGSTGIFLGILFGIYKVHTKYFRYLIVLQNRKNNHE